MKKIISGGQTGVDQAALKAARKCGIATGGKVPKGYVTESGPAPWLADYDVEEYVQGYYRRTVANVKYSDATLILVKGDLTTKGTELTLRTVHEYRKPCSVIDLDAVPEKVDANKLLLLDWLDQYNTVNVAGPRESSKPGIGSQAREFLTDVFTRYKEK